MRSRGTRTLPRMATTQRRRVTVDNTALARRVGTRLKVARARAGLTQAQLAGDRYTKAYVSALENGLTKPSMAALDYLSARLGTSASAMISDEAPIWSRLEADVNLAAGHWQEAADAYADLLESAIDPGARAELLSGRAEALARLDQPNGAASAASEAAEIFNRHGREADAARASYWLAGAEYEQENAADARAILGSILSKLRAGLRVEPDFQLRVLMLLATIEARDGNHAEALAYLDEIRGLSAELDDRRRATYLFDLAFSYRATGDLEAAIRTGLASLTLFRAMEANSETAMAENMLALTHLALGNIARAEDLAAAARARFESLHDERWLADVEETQAQIALAKGEPAEALEMVERSLALATKTGYRKAEMGGLVTKARALVALGRPDEASGCNEQATELARASKRPARLREVLGAWAGLLASQGNHKRAYELSREALTA